MTREPAGETLRSGTGEGPAGAAPGTLSPGDRVGDYVLDEPLGEGSQGRVWKAHHAAFPERTVALKALRGPALVDLLRRERLLEHGSDVPGGLRVEAVDLDAAVPHLVQEYAAGGDLDALLAREGPLEPRRALRILAQVVATLRQAHGRGVAHGDLKPRNILLDSEGKARIGDFGLGLAATAIALTRLHASSGTDAPRSGRWLEDTWEYLAPERRRPGAGPRSADPSADVFSLGVILHEMLTGERPAGRVSLERVSPAVDALFAGCWTRRQERLRDAGEVARALDAVRRGKPPGSHGTPSSPDGGSSRSRHAGRGRRVAAYGIPAAMLLGGVALVAWMEHRAPPPRPAPVRVAPGPAFAGEDQDEAEELYRIRQRLETRPVTVEEARGELAAFRARADDRNLAGLARRWQELLPEDRVEREYEVRWKRYRVDREGYRKAVWSLLEPGRPDVYLRVWRTRDGEEELIHDGMDRPVEAWTQDWTGATEYPTFRLAWRPGDGLRVEMWDADLFGDEMLARWELGGELAILLLSSPRRAPQGHAVEFLSEFRFGE